MIESEEDKVYHLKIALYELKQSPHAWNSKIDKYLLDHKFSRSLSEPFLYMKTHVDHFLILYLYVNDLIYIGTNVKMIKNFKKTMM